MYAAQLGLPLGAFFLFWLWTICFHPNNRLIRIPLQIAHHLFFFPPLALTHAEQTDVGIATLAISISRDNDIARAHYLIDSNSLPTYYIVTFLLRRTRHFPPRRDGCFIMFKRTIYCSRVDPRSLLLGRLGRRYGGNSRVSFFSLRDSTTFSRQPRPRSCQVLSLPWFG